jgi:hypothetical protein
MITLEEQKLIDSAKAKVIASIERHFSLIQEYFQSDLSLARFATNNQMTIWQFKWLLHKYNIPPKAKKYRDRREIRKLSESFEEDDDSLAKANPNDDLSDDDYWQDR